MIHSLSGGVIADGTPRLFAKVEVGGVPRWYLSPFPKLNAGDRVLVPSPVGNAEGKVIRTEYCSPQTAPVPIRRAQEILALLGQTLDGADET